MRRSPLLPKRFNLKYLVCKNCPSCFPFSHFPCGQVPQEPASTLPSTGAVPKRWISASDKILLEIWCPFHTGSFRKNGKSKTVFMGTKFHEKLIFSAFFSRELATNLRSWGIRSVTITLWHPEKVAPPVWFQAQVGWLRLTTASNP